MRILRVQLINIKSYIEQTVVLAEGTNSICGHNGAGKTTIVEAIGWALFDSLPYSQRLFVRDGATGGEVIVTFGANDGREYQICRRAGSRAHWYVFDPELHSRVAEGSADVRGWISRQMGIEGVVLPGELFESAVGVAQGGLTAPFLLSVERRRDAFNPILRVNEYADAFDQLRETRSYIQEKLQAQDALIGKLSVEADRIPQVREQIEAADKQVGLTQGQLREVTRDLERAAAQVAALEAEEERIRALEQTARLLKQDVASVQESRRQAERDVRQAWEAHEIVERSMKGHNLFLAAENRLRELAPEYEACRQLQSNLQVLEQQLEHIEARIVEIARGISEAEAAERDLDQLQARASESERLDREVHALEREVGKLPSLRTEVSRLADQMQDGERESHRVRSEIDRIESLRSRAAVLPRLQANNDDLGRRLHEAELASQRLGELEKDEADQQRRVEEVSAKLKLLEKKAGIAPEVERLAVSVDGLRERQIELKDAGIELTVRKTEVETRKQAAVVYCPLKREDCLEMQRQEQRDQQLDKELAGILADLSAARKRYSECAKELEAAERAAKQVQESRVSGAALQGERRLHEDALSRLSSVRAEMPRYRDLATGLPKLRADLDRLVRELQAAERAALEVGRLNDLKQAAERQSAQTQELRERKAAVEKEAEELRRRGDALTDLKSQARELESAHDEYAQARMLVAGLQKQRQTHAMLSNEQSDRSRRIAELREGIEKYGPIEAKMREMERQRDENRQPHESYLTNLSVSEQLTARQLELKRLENEAGRKSTELAAQEERLREAEKGWSEERFVQVRETCADLQRQSGSLKATIAHECARLEDLRAELAIYEERERERADALKEKDRLQRLFDVLAFARETIKSAQKPVTEALLYSISQEARLLFSEIVDDHSARLEWTPDYEIVLERGSERLTFNQLSGGEQMSAALAVRLALLKKLSDVDIAFLDEPTQNMDETRRTNLAAQVGALRGFGQLFVISHDDTFERQVNHAIVVRKQNGESVVTYGNQE